MVNENYVGRVVRVKNVRKHPNADRLQLANCFINTIIIDLNVKEGDLGVYFPSGCKLGKEFCEVNNLLRLKDENGNNIGGYLDEKKRNVKALKLRGVISDGIFLPLQSLSTFTNIHRLKENDTISVLNGFVISEKYIPINSKTPRLDPAIKIAKQKEWPCFFEHKDTPQLAYNLQKFNENDECVILLKMHGCSGRSSHTIHMPYVKESLFTKIKQYFFPFKHIEYGFVCGSKTIIIDDFNKNDGYYGTEEFRRAHHEKIIQILPKNFTIYYEIVGYISPNRPIMPDCDNAALNDSEFIKIYGNKTKFSYNCNEDAGESDIYVYRITVSNEDGFNIDLHWDMVKELCNMWNLKHVPELDRFKFTTIEDLLERVEQYVSGSDPIGRTHWREGIVVRIINKFGFKVYKEKNDIFKLMEENALDLISSSKIEVNETLIDEV